MRVKNMSSNRRQKRCGKARIVLKATHIATTSTKWHWSLSCYSSAWSFRPFKNLHAGKNIVGMWVKRPDSSNSTLQGLEVLAWLAQEEKGWKWDLHQDEMRWCSKSNSEILAVPVSAVKGGGVDAHFVSNTDDDMVQFKNFSSGWYDDFFLFFALTKG